MCRTKSFMFILFSPKNVKTRSLQVSLLTSGIRILNIYKIVNKAPFLHIF